MVWRHLGGLCSPVELRQLHQSVCRYVPVQDTVDDRRDRREEQVEEDEHPGVGHEAPRETTEELIPEQQIHIHLQTQKSSSEDRSLCPPATAAKLGTERCLR